MWAKKIIAVTDSKECQEDLLRRIAKLARAKVDALILREKHLSEALYFDLAKEVLKICAQYKLMCFLHSFDKVALKLNHRYFHCPFNLLKKEPRLSQYFHILGTSVHNQEEYFFAEYTKCNYVIAGHIFPSPSKKHLYPRGLSFLNELCKNAKLPIYAIGGINLENIAQFKDTDISGVCMKSALMQCKNAKNFMQEARFKLEK